MARTVPLAVVETPEFLSACRKLMNENERAMPIGYLAYNPASGDLITGTGAFASFAGGWRDAANGAALG